MWSGEKGSGDEEGVDESGLDAVHAGGPLIDQQHLIRPPGHDPPQSRLLSAPLPGHSDDGCFARDQVLIIWPILGPQSR